MRIFASLVCLCGLLFSVQAAAISRSPYIGAIVVDASDGSVLFEDGADKVGYPASMLKLMDLYLVLEGVDEGRLVLDAPVYVSREAERMGGSQVFLATGEVFPLEEMLYALMIQSANDAAVAIAEHVGGTRDAFVELMNRKARELGMTTTVFQSPHGLPPGAGQRPDLTTPRDFAKLCVALIHHHPEALKYTSETFRIFRPAKPFEMRTHNHLLKSFAGCDGLKTGFYRDAGFSIAATAEREGRRVVAVVMGSQNREERDARARDLMGQYILSAKPMAKAAPPPKPVAKPKPEPPPPELAPVVEAAAADGAGDLDDPAPLPPPRRGFLGTLGWMLLGAFIMAVVFLSLQRRRGMRR